MSSASTTSAPLSCTHRTRACGPAAAPERLGHLRLGYADAHTTGAGRADRGQHDRFATNACGEVATGAAELLVCTADWTCDGTANSTDVSTFISDWFTDVAKGTFRTDIDGNQVVNSTDVSQFINFWFEDVESGC